MKEIRLSKSNSGWNATWLVDGQPDPEIVHVFGTNTIPTAYTKHALAEDVQAELAKLNPYHLVTIAER